ncbi:MAG: efflux RND transporter periplasmic adaptor subunit [Deltaproteobacteria bacterium]|nr:efflux RND transporter periplasmic adaptor subunit [Deltaproteobacteria bacterium]
MKKQLIGLVILVVLILAGWQIYRTSDLFKGPPPIAAKPSIAVEVQPIVTTTIREVEIFTGTLLPESQYNVAPKISGRLEKLFVNIGDEVTQDQLIAVLNDDEFTQQVDQARAELDVARANIEENRSTLDAQVAQKEAELKTNEVRLAYTQIKASWENGSESRVVGERFVDEGGMLTANSPIVSIIDISSLKAIIHVIETDYPRVKMGQKALITTDAFPGRVFEGSIARIAPILKEAARQARVEIDVPNAEGLLKPGMFVRVEIEFARHDNATVIPVDSLVKSNGDWGLFIADRETMRAKFVQVTPGIVSGTIAEIVEPQISGLVVTVGQHLLEDGSLISLPEKSQEPSS